MNRPLWIFYYSKRYRTKFSSNNILEIGINFIQLNNSNLRFNIWINFLQESTISLKISIVTNRPSWPEFFIILQNSFRIILWNNNRCVLKITINFISFDINNNSTPGDKFPPRINDILENRELTDNNSNYPWMLLEFRSPRIDHREFFIIILSNNNRCVLKNNNCNFYRNHNSTPGDKYPFQGIRSLKILENEEENRNWK